MAWVTSWPRAENWYSTTWSRGTLARCRLVASSTSSSVREARAWYATRRQSIPASGARGAGAAAGRGRGGDLAGMAG